MYELFIQQHLPLGCGVRVWILTQGWSPNFLKSRSRSPSKKEDCFWIFMHFLQCCIIFVQLDWTYTGNLSFVCVILCTILQHAMTEMRFK